MSTARHILVVGAGIAGVQPKIMVPERARVPIPSLIVKTGGPAYPDLASNEFLCLSAARTAGIAVPPFALSDDGRMLVLDRFDLVPQANGRLERLGFEDIAARQKDLSLALEPKWKCLQSRRAFQEEL